MENVVIVAARRTAVGKFLGSIGGISASTLGAKVIQALLAQTGVLPERIDEVILGQVLTAATGQNPARQASIEGGLPHEVPAMTINKVCGRVSSRRPKQIAILQNIPTGSKNTNKSDGQAFCVTV